MPRRSNTTARAMAVLEFLAAHPSEAFGLSELARELDVNKATLLSIVTTLLDGGWLLQHPTRRSYTLGPTLIGTGAAALTRFPDTRPLTPFMDEIVRSYGVACVAAGVADGQLVVLHRVGFADPLHGLARMGVRMQFAPPFGLSLAAWYPPEQFDLWVAAATPPLDRSELDRVRRAVRAAHEHGYVIGVDVPEHHELGAMLREQRFTATGVDPSVLDRFAGALRGTGYHLDDPQPDERYRVNHVAAPVRTSTSVPQVALLVPMYGATETGERLTDLGAALADAGRRAAAETAL